MDHIREIQEIVDVHQGGTPTEVARVVMKNTQSLYDIHANMYKLIWTTVKSRTHRVTAFSRHILKIAVSRPSVSRDAKHELVVNETG